MILAKDLWLFCDNEVANWADVRFAASLKARSSTFQHGPPSHTSERIRRAETSLQSTDSKRDMMSLLDLRALWSGHLGLPQLVTRFRAAQCKDPRDRVYALLALIGPEARGRIVVDYNKPLSQLFLETYYEWSESTHQSNADQGTCEDMVAPEFQDFQVEIMKLLPYSELDSLWQSEQRRREITVGGKFTSSTLSEITSVYTIARMDDIEVMSLSDAIATGFAHRGLVVRLSIRAYLQSGIDQDLFVYAHGDVEQGDLLARIGSRLFFFRRPKSQEECDPIKSGLLALCATGSEILQKHNDPLESQHLLHPCVWVRRQLNDASFKITNRKGSLVQKRMQRFVENVEIRCNGAGIVVLLLESKLQGELVRSSPERIESSETMQPLNGEPRPRLSNRWCPFRFGIEHRLLEPCLVCEAQSTTTFNSRRQQSLHEIGRRCTCSWIS